MSFNQQLHGRAILLEEFKKGVVKPVHALDAVLRELGAGVMAVNTANKYYAQFKDGDFSIDQGTNSLEKKWIEEGTLLKIKRGLFRKTTIKKHFSHITTSGETCRFQFFEHRMKDLYEYWFLDTLNTLDEQEKKLILQVSKSSHQSPDGPISQASQVYRLKSIHFIRTKEVLVNDEVFAVDEVIAVAQIIGSSIICMLWRSGSSLPLLLFFRIRNRSDCLQLIFMRPIAIEQLTWMAISSSRTALNLNRF
ncbi:hypothetical protein M3Y94_00479700 [Aphelenchoides besseyi]|nr:hypothetical protein M3Y94_00479700 [Aphelenchoides besseyi]